MRVGKLVSHGLVAAAVLLANSGHAAAAQWYKAGYSQAILMGLGMVNETTGFVSGGRSDGHSNVLKTTDGGKSFVEVPTAPAMFQLGLAVESEETALVTGVGLLSGGCQYLMDHGARFNDSAMSNILVQMSQDAQVVRGCSGEGAGRTVAAIGRFQEDNGAGDNVNGYALSTDGGATFSFIDIGQNQTLYPARYGAFPDCQTAFITTGTWPKRGEQEITHRLSLHEHGKLHLRKGSASKPHHHRHSHRHHARAAAPIKSDFWSGSIARTTDGGKTFTNMFTTNTFYFNQIACPSVRVCFAVGENEDDGFVFSTSDGGLNWSQILQVSGTSLMSVSALSESEVYIAGGVLAETGIAGKVFVSRDGGKTFDTQTADGFYFTKLQMVSSSKGFATATDEQQQSDVLIYY